MSAKLTDAIRPFVLLQGVTGLTGGGTNLDGIATVSLTVPLYGIVVFGGNFYCYLLRAGTDSASSPSIIRPTDYNSVSNQKVWALQALVGGAAPTGTAGGDLSGSYPNPGLAKIGGDALPSNVAHGFLKRNAANNAWEEVAYGSASDTVCQGNDSRLSDSRAPNGSAGGDLGGTYPNPTVAQISGALSTDLTVNARLIADKWSNTQSSLSYSATTNIDFNGVSARTITLTGNVTFTTSNLAAGKLVKLIITADSGGPYTFSFPGWKFLGAAAPANIAASKTAVLTLEATSGSDSGVLAAYAVQP